MSKICGVVCGGKTSIVKAFAAAAVVVAVIAVIAVVAVAVANCCC